MGVFNILLKRSREDPTDTNTSHVGYLSKSDFPKAFFNGYTRLDKHPEIVAAVDKLSDLISNMTIHLMAKDEHGNETRIRDELSRKLDINPNKFMTRKQFINNIVRNLLLYGNQITIPNYVDGYLDNLIPIANGNVEYFSNSFGYKIKIDGKEIDPTNVLHFVLNPDPDDPYIGLGHRVVLSDILKNLSQANKTKQGYMSQKYSPSMIIAVEADGSATDWPETRQMILDDYVKSNEVGAPMVIPSSFMKTENVRPLTLQDLAINETVEIDKKTVAAVLGIPPYFLGAGTFDRDEYNNFVETKVKSVANILQQEFTKKLIYSKNMFIRFNHHSLLDYSLTDWAKIGKDLKAIGVMKGNEVRNKIGLDFDNNPALNEFTILENYIKIEDIDKQKKLLKGGED